MAPITFHLLILQPSVDSDSFVSGLKALPDSQRPLWFGRVHHWMHEPHLSVDALLGRGPHVENWEYLLVGQDELPAGVEGQVLTKWSITTDSPDGMPSLHTRGATSTPPAPSLPQGWSPEDYSGLDAAVAPKDLAFSLDEKSHTLGSAKSSGGKTVKNFVRDFGTSNPGPIVMFNLLSFLPGQRSVYFEGYGDGFQKKIGPAYGGLPIHFGLGATSWSSQSDEAQQDGAWEDAALIWYPSIWHFAKMLDDPVYADLDRKFKSDSLRDNPLTCCTEIEL